MNRQNKHPHRSRGSALAMMVLLSVVVTGMVMVLAYSAGLQASQIVDYGMRDKAFFAAEAGLQDALWEIKNGKITTSTTFNGTIADCAFSISCTKNGDGSFTLASAGKLGIANASVTGVVQPVSNPVLAVGGNLGIALANITGDVVVMGGVSQNLASGSLLTNITGKVSSAGPIGLLPSNGSTTLKLLFIPLAYASNGFYQNQIGLSKPSALAMYNSLSTGYPASLLNLSLLSVVDIPSMGGTVHVRGSVNVSALSLFKGPGTVIIDGDLIGALATFGSATAPVNVIVRGNCVLAAGTINGSLYVCGNYLPLLAGSLTINNGSIVVDGDMALGLLSALTINKPTTGNYQLVNFNRL